MLFNRLHPAGEPAPVEALVPADGPRLRLNMVATLDGRAAIEGSSRELGGEADLAMLVALRAWAQALIVGTGTLRAEGYGRIREDLPVVVVTRSGDVPWEAGLFAAAAQPVLVFSDAEVAPPPGVAAAVEVLPGAEPRSVVERLRERGYERVLCEGGPTLNRTLLADGVVDELFLTLTPLLTADAEQPRLVEGRRFESPLPARLLSVAEARGELFLRYALERAAA